MKTVPEKRHVPESGVSGLPLLFKVFIAIVSGALLAAATAQALEMLHH